MATLSPLVHASVAVQVHVVFALLAVVLAPIQLLRPKHGSWHRRLGYIWISAMFITAVSSFWITEVRLMGPYSPIHLLSVLTVFGLWQGLSAAKRNDHAAHAAAMRGLAFWALGIAGAFTLLPGRRMHQVLFSELPPGSAIVAIVALVAVLVLPLRRSRRPVADKMQKR